MTKQTVLITGGAKRIGRAIAISLAKQGYSIAIHYNKSQNEAEDLANQLKKYHAKTCTIKADLSKPTEVKKIFPFVNEKIGQVDCLINNAAIIGKDDIFDVSQKSWSSHIETNLHAPVVLSQQFALQHKSSGGNIINMLDYCVLNLPDDFLSYTISKSGLFAATKMLGLKLAPEIRVNAIAPGHSLINDKESPEKFELAKKATPLQNGADIDEICRSIDFILNSPSMTGQVIALDGGKNLVGAEFY